MSRGDKVDVMATHLLEPHHDVCHVRGGHTFTISQMADVVILAKNAPKITVGEEDGPRTVISNQGRLLAEMGKGTRDHELRPGLADSHLPVQAIDLALSRTKPTLLKEFLQELDSLAELSFFIKTKIGWGKSHSNATP